MVFACLRNPCALLQQACDFRQLRHRDVCIAPTQPKDSLVRFGQLRIASATVLRLHPTEPGRHGRATIRPETVAGFEASNDSDVTWGPREVGCEDAGFEKHSDVSMLLS